MCVCEWVSGRMCVWVSVQACVCSVCQWGGYMCGLICVRVSLDACESMCEMRWVSVSVGIDW